jgi:hypothetical protein
MLEVDFRELLNNFSIGASSLQNITKPLFCNSGSIKIDAALFGYDVA